MRRKSNLHFENKKQNFLLVFLFLIIIGLIITILIYNKQHQNTVTQTSTPPTECTDFEESNDFANCIESRFNSTNDLQELINDYRKAIDISKDKQRYYTAANLIISRTNYLITLNHCQQAMKLLDAENLNGYDTNTKGHVYSRALDASTECKDETAKSKWNDLLIENNQEVKNAIGT